MMRRFGLISAVMVLALALVAGPAAGIPNGQPDGDDHPQVGLLIFDNADGVPVWRCTGTLLSPTVLLTAGHCTFGTDGGRVWFETEVTDPNYPFAGGTSVEFDTIHTHPDYNDSAFVLHDVGVVILAEPVTGVEYGTLTDVGILDELAVRRGVQSQQFTPVGYGLQSVVPELRADLVRYQATVGLIDVKGTAGIPAGTSVMFTNNPGQRNTGGMCFGDSGGPVFVRGTLEIVAVTSFALNQNCVGVGGGYRVDTTDDQSFINGFLEASNG
jgi:secreted trypsin-like serine protease